MRALLLGPPVKEGPQGGMPPVKRPFALILLIAGIGATAFSSSFSGIVEVCTTFDKGGVLSFDTVVDIDYTISNITLGATAVFELAEFDLLFFTAAGTLGPIDFRSMLAFDPQTTAYVVWTNAAKISLGGATLFGLTVMDTHDTADLPFWTVPEMGVGAAVGIIGSVGDVSITATSFFNIAPMLGLSVYWYGYDYIVTLDAFELCGEWHIADLYRILEPNCDLCWDGAVIAVDFPFACLDVTALTFIGRSSSLGDVGFGSLLLWLRDIGTGIPWLTLADLMIEFDVDSKDVGLYLDLVLGDFVCVTPYLSLDGSHFWTVDGITLNALLLEYTYDGVTVKAGEIFDNEWCIDEPFPELAHWGFTLDGGLAPLGSSLLSVGCVYDQELNYDEFFGIWIDGDSCCGGAFNVGLISFFDTSQTGVLFDWAETVATFGIGVGTNVTVELSLSVKADGLQWFKICGGSRF